MKQIYMNYASSHPFKSERMIRGLEAYLEENRHLSGGRNVEGLEEGRVHLRARLALAKALAAERPEQVIFTSGATASLNMILGGFLKEGDHVLATSVEHNAAARPLHLLQKKGVIEVDFLPCGKDGSFDPGEIKTHIKPNTRLLVMTHASNVLGTILPATESFALAKDYGLFTVLDAAQTAGFLPVQLDGLTDAIAFTGHKALGALQGAGGFALRRGAEAAIDPWLAGGTGSFSGSLDQPEALPDKYESGTPNTLGILSLALAAEELLAKDLSRERKRERALLARFLDGAARIPGLVVHGTGAPQKSLPIVSVSAPGHDCALLARDIYDRCGVITRPGLHCAPLAHICAGTYPEGTVRFSFGPETIPEDIDAALEGLAALLAPGGKLQCS